MGLLVNGVWRDKWYDTKSQGGAFRRPETRFRDRVTAGGASGFKAAAGRYRLYVSLACPWAHRTLIFRKLKRLEAAIPVSVVDPIMGPEGWTFSDNPGCTPDTDGGFTRLYELYLAARPDYTGRVTVPVLWDRERKMIVNNESSEIIRMLNREFDACGDPSVDFRPAALEDEIDALNEFIYDSINNGVYKAGFATAQDAYDAAVDQLFNALDTLEARLEMRRYLLGAQITEADWRLFTTLVRFDAVYVTHFKCNLRRLVDYPNLWGYVRDLYQVPGVAGTVDFDHIKRHYFMSHPTINPNRIVPRGPVLDFAEPHGRERLAAAGPI
jgi:putative glutathione S-transferase